MLRQVYVDEFNEYVNSEELVVETVGKQSLINPSKRYFDEDGNMVAIYDSGMEEKFWISDDASYGF